MAFANRVVLITDASSMIGIKCAEYYGKEEAHLALVERDAEKFENIIEKLKESGIESEPLIILGDVCIDAARIIGETIGKYSRLDVLINNAECMIPGSFESMQMEHFDAMMATNLRSTVEVTKYAIPYLLKSLGNIVNISSSLGLVASYTNIVYSMTKAGMNHFTKCLAIDLAQRGVRVNAICPGFGNETNLKYYPRPSRDANELIAKGQSLQQNDLVDDCVKAISFLTKESASFITGAIIRVDGGMSINSFI